ncbi:hypothetical protein RB195_004548 [Necator americanus]|uniref:Uncharacterized protein n=1 Tax=Necator americanus TaxID=51031 RepID=A0ABR1BLY7_NECAM
MVLSECGSMSWLSSTTIVYCCVNICGDTDEGLKKDVLYILSVMTPEKRIQGGYPVCKKSMAKKVCMAIFSVHPYLKEDKDIKRVQQGNLIFRHVTPFWVWKDAKDKGERLYDKIYRTLEAGGSVTTQPPTCAERDQWQLLHTSPATVESKKKN